MRIVVASTAAAALVIGAVGIALWSGRRPPPDTQHTDAASRCGACHEAQVAAWARSHHALAEGPVRPGLPERMPLDGELVVPEGVIGVSPLVQYLVRIDGSLQATTTAWDVDSQEWFSTLAAPVPVDSWAHTEGGGNTWATSCAPCHATGVRLVGEAGGFRAEIDAHGVTCAACHGDTSAHVDEGAPVVEIPAARRDDVCLPCHTRRTELQTGFQPGDRYLDHYSPQLVDGVHHYVDGQVRDEVFEGVAFWGSAMHRAGVRCIDCHDPHGGELLAPGDAVCARCHGGDHDPLHEAEQVGCVDCHMPVTVYMQRDPRHDHGLRVPDPVLGAELGLPSACDRCHNGDVGPAYARAWPSRRGHPDRRRVRTWAAAHRGDRSAAEAVAEAIGSGPAAWRATTATLAGPLGAHPVVRGARGAALGADEPLVRLAAARPVGAASPHDPRLLPLLDDDVAAVQITAALGLGALADATPAGAQRDTYLQQHRHHPDALVGSALLAQERGQLEAEGRFLDRAVQVAPHHLDARRARAMARARAGDLRGAMRDLRQASTDHPGDPEVAYLLGLALSEAGELEEAEGMLKQAAPVLPDAGYNLGLLLAAQHRHREAMVALFRAEELAPDDVRVRFAIATVLRDWGRRPEARAAAQRVLELAPDHAGATALLRELTGRRAAPAPAPR